MHGYLICFRTVLGGAVCANSFSLESALDDIFRSYEYRDINHEQVF
jgi:hypothetical protein